MGTSTGSAIGREGTSRVKISNIRRFKAANTATARATGRPAKKRRAKASIALL
jgi:hypothetical protein